ncbi:unnamed protein product [Gadus morhua 'NCC']
MPEGPELHLASLFVNKVCEGVVFTGPVTKSAVSKNCDVSFICEAYRIQASSRGKEVKLTLTPIKSDVKEGSTEQTMDIVFRFGMSGYFRFTSEDELPKHAHLRFFSNEKPCRVLSFVDTRRFGSWQPNGSWQRGRGPCVMFEYESFRKKVLSNLSNRAFERPICEALLNQNYFNGIGNYLRAEILFRLSIPPFVQARTVLESLELEDLAADTTPEKEELDDQKTSDRESKRTSQPADLLRLCHTVPLEVVNMGGKGYDPQKADYSDFQAWLRCYYVAGMKSTRDHNGRTMWFSGDSGPMVPKECKSTKAKKRVKKEDNDAAMVAEIVPKVKTEKCVKQEARNGKTGLRKRKVKQEGEVTRTCDNTRCLRSNKTSEAR